MQLRHAILARTPDEQGVALADVFASLVRTAALIGVLLVAAGLLGFAAYLVKMMKTLGADPAALAALANRIAKGDLSVGVQCKPGDTDSVVARMVKMQTSLYKVVTQVRQGSE